MKLGEFNILKINNNRFANIIERMIAPFNYDLLLNHEIIEDALLELDYFKSIAHYNQLSLNYIGYPTTGVIQPEPLGIGLPFFDPGQMLDALSPYTYKKMRGNEHILAATAFVSFHGQIQIQGTNNPSMGINCLIPGIAPCLGVLIKDEEGNITASHRTISEQYDQGSIASDIERHQGSFGVRRRCLLNIAGLALTKGGLARLEEDEYEGLKEIHPNELERSVASRFPDTNFSFNYHPNRATGRASSNLRISITDMLGSNITGAPIAVKQYWGRRMK